MKKIFTVVLVSSILIIVACSSEELLKQNNLTENISETLAVETNQNTSETKTFLETAQTTTMPVTSISKVKKLDLGEIYKYSSMFLSSNKFIYFTDYGRYYQVEIGGRQSANYVWCYEGRNSEPKILTETEDSTVIYCDKNSVYLSKYIWHDNKYLRYKLEKDSIIAIDELPFAYDKYYIENYIYYSIKNNDAITIYRMDQGKNNSEVVVDLPESVEKYIVYDNKIWYDYSNKQGISYYDLEACKTENFDKGKLGIINNGYIYYTYYKEPGKLLRFNLSNYKYEEVCGTEKNPNGKPSEQDNMYAFDFYEDYILYSLGNLLYRYSDNENTLIFSAEDYSVKYGRIDGIYCQDNRIFIKMCSGAFYQCIMEIDIDGNVIEVIHED